MDSELVIDGGQLNTHYTYMTGVETIYYRLTTTYSVADLHYHQDGKPYTAKITTLLAKKGEAMKFSDVEVLCAETIQADGPQAIRGYVTRQHANYIASHLSF